MSTLPLEVEKTWTLCLKYGAYNLIFWLLIIGGLLLLAYCTPENHLFYEQ